MGGLTMSLIDEHPSVQAVDAQLADLKKRRAEFEERAAVLAEQDTKAQQAYDKAVEEHLLRGDPMPSQPTLQLPEQAVEIRRQFMFEETQLREQRRQAMAEAYDGILDEASDETEKLTAKARPTVEKLVDMMAEVSALLSAVQHCRAARNGWNGSVGPKQFRDGRFTIEAFVRLVATGSNPVDLLDLVGSGQGKPVDPVGGSQPPASLTVGDIQQLLRIPA
jgi:hypothetical protein